MLVAPRSLVQWMALASLGLLMGCTALLDTDTAQCERDADCAAKGTAFAGLVCSADKVCAEAPCTDHTLCTTRYKEDGYCVESKCQPLKTNECSALWPPPPYKNTNVVLTGFMASLRGDDASYGQPQLDGAAVALRQIERSLGLLEVPGAVPTPRSLVMLVCDQGNWQEAARHLVKDLRVPAIVGASYSSVTREMTRQVQGDGVLVFSQAATAPDLTTVASSTGLLWRTAPSDVFQMETMKRLHDRVVVALKAQNIANPKLLITIKDDAAGQGLFDAAKAMASPSVVTQPAPALSFERAIRLPPPTTKPDSPDWLPKIQEVLDVQPDVIMHLGTAEFGQAMMEKIEERWPVGARKPWYLMPEGMRVGELLTMASNHPEWKLHERVIGAAPGARRDALWNEFVGSHRSFATASLGLENQQPGNLAEYAYDAVYLLAYAIGRTRVAAPTGNQLMLALREVSCKGSTKLEIGPGRYADSYRAASTIGSCVDYKGPSGDLDFNPEVGEAPSDQSVWCLRRSSRGYGFEPALTPYYSSATGTLPSEGLDFTKPDWCTANP